MGLKEGASRQTEISCARTLPNPKTDDDGTVKDEDVDEDDDNDEQDLMDAEEDLIDTGAAPNGTIPSISAAVPPAPHASGQRKGDDEEEAEEEEDLLA